MTAEELKAKAKEGMQTFCDGVDNLCRLISELPIPTDLDSKDKK